MGRSGNSMSTWAVAKQLRHQRMLFCRLFPSNFEFEEDILVQLWNAMGFSGNSYFKVFLDEGYIIRSRTDILTEISKYKINVDKVTTFSDKVESENLYALIDGDITAGMDISRCTHVSVASKSINQTTLFKTLEAMTKLRAVLLIRENGSSVNQIPSTFFKAHPLMQALDLSGSHISELSSSIRDMTHLRFLDLSCTPIERIPESICHLEELQTLKLKGCKRLHKLPEGICNLTSLRHLDFDVLGQLTSMPKEMGFLRNLRTLSAFIVSEEDGCSLKELKNLNGLGGSFCISGLESASCDDAKEAAMQDKKHLTRLHLKWNGCILYTESARRNAESTVNHLQPNSVLEELQISYFPGNALPDWIMSGDYDQLVGVTLFRCENSSFALSSLKNLKYLNIIDMNGVVQMFVSGASNKRLTKLETLPIVSGASNKGLPNLETLTIDRMNKLQTWTGVKSSEDLPCLWKLSVKNCPELTGLYFLQHLSSLTYLEISHCKSFESLPKLPTSLKTLMINQCHSLNTRYSERIEDWENIKHVPNIWIDMKRIGSANKETGSD